MGACCTNELRDKKLDRGEARLEDLCKEGVVERAIKPKSEHLSPSEEDAMFQQEAQRVRSPNEQVNVRV